MKKELKMELEETWTQIKTCFLKVNSPIACEKATAELSSKTVTFTKDTGEVGTCMDME